MPKNVRDLGKLFVAKGLIKWPKVQKKSQSGHTGLDINTTALGLWMNSLHLLLLKTSLLCQIDLYRSNFMMSHLCINSVTNWEIYLENEPTNRSMDRLVRT